jgi:hypothetical protein
MPHVQSISGDSDAETVTVKLWLLCSKGCEGEALDAEIPGRWRVISALNHSDLVFSGCHHSRRCQTRRLF